MTFANRSLFPDRTFGLLCSLAIHAALGIALIAWPSTSSRGERTKDKTGEVVLVVELLPLSNTGTDARESKSDPGSTLLAPGGNAPSASGEKTPVPEARGLSSVEASGGVEVAGTQSEPSSQAPSGGAQIRSGAEVQQFRALLLRHIERFRRYPDEARQAGLEGTVQVHFEMNRQGEVLDVWIEMSSGSRILDDEAIAAVLRARPLPPPPASWPAPMGVTLPIGYKLK